MEIEKKYLVDPKRIKELKDQAYYFEKIDQYYLSDINDTWTIRLRKTYDTIIRAFFLTLKSKGLLSREEIEIKIPVQLFEENLQHARTALSKTRYHVEIDPDLGFEIDVYKDYDFITCEVEFETEEEAKSFVAPDWCIKDITEDPYYKNVNLAKPI